MGLGVCQGVWPFRRSGTSNVAGNLSALRSDAGLRFLLTSWRSCGARFPLRRNLWPADDLYGFVENPAGRTSDVPPDVSILGGGVRRVLGKLRGFEDLIN